MSNASRNISHTKRRRLVQEAERFWWTADPEHEYEPAYLPTTSRTITVHEDDPAVDTGILDKDGNMIRRRTMRPIGFVHHGEH